MKLRLPLSILKPIPIITTPKSTSQQTLLYRKMSTTTIQPIFSLTYPTSRATQDLSPLLRSNGGKWTLIASGKGIERSFKFKGFKRCWEFMNMIAPECVKVKHHPEWSNLYNTTFIRWTTHSPSGLSEKDVIMARFCDERAEELGEVYDDGEEGGEKEEEGKELVDRVVFEGGDCCVPKSAKVRLRRGGWERLLGMRLRRDSWG